MVFVDRLLARNCTPRFGGRYGLWAGSVFSDPFSHLPLSSVLVSRQIQHSLSTAAVTVVAAVAVVSMAAVEAAEAFTVAAAVAFTVEDLTVAGGLLVAVVTTKGEAFVVGKGPDLMKRAAAMERAAVPTAGLELGAALG